MAIGSSEGIAFLSIDPGIEMGWALWSGNHGDLYQCVPPFATGVVVPHVKGDWGVRVVDTLSRFRAKLKSLVKKYSMYQAYIEDPVFYDNAGGHMVAKSGDLGKLQFTVGWLSADLHRAGIAVELVPVPTWKGQLKKEVVIKRIRRKLGPEACVKIKSHAWDAVGIGLWAKGHGMDV